MKRLLMLLSPGESDIDDNNLCDIPSNLILEAAAPSHHRNRPQSFEDILAQEESLLSDDGLENDGTPSRSCHRAYSPALSTAIIFQL
jgi:hypothetical protein